jgi:hypothetical protein
MRRSCGTLGLAHHWQHLLDTAKVGSLKEIAAAEGMDLGQVSRIARLAQLVRWVVAGCLAEDNGPTLENNGLGCVGLMWHQ